MTAGSDKDFAKETEKMTLKIDLRRNNLIRAKEG